MIKDGESGKEKIHTNNNFFLFIFFKSQIGRAFSIRNHKKPCFLVLEFQKEQTKKNNEL